VDEPDLALLERWRAGERAAGQALLARHFDHLYRFFRNKCDDADELVQTTLVACMDSIERFRGDSSFRTYMFAIARNTLLHYLRDRKRDERFDPAVTSVADVVTSVRTVLARDQSHRTLLEALRQLPVEQQSLLELHYWEELDTLELGAVFEVPPNTIRQWLFRARAKLRDLLAASAPEVLDDLDRNVREA
jgi:RNA polymerase sigma factor (sigma-70 family)